jgi:acyl carrier protein
MEDKEIFAKLERILRDKLELSEETKITLDTNPRVDLAMDSLDGYELLYAVEDEFGITIPDTKALEFETVRDCYDYLKCRV